MCTRRKTLSLEGLVYSMGVHCILLDLKFFHIVYCDSNENRYSLVRENILNISIQQTIVLCDALSYPKT